jgi:predicted AAA+ superfamily ATPase
MKKRVIIIAVVAIVAITATILLIAMNKKPATIATAVVLDITEGVEDRHSLLLFAIQKDNYAGDLMSAGINAETKLVNAQGKIITISDIQPGQLVELTYSGVLETYPATYVDVYQVTANPDDFVRQTPNGLLIIDEIQRVPELILSIKEVVDENTRPGQFLITGSSDLSDISTVRESLAGRMESVELCCFSQEELHDASSTLIDALFSDRSNLDFIGTSAALSRADYLNLALAGGYPEAVFRASKSRRDAWFDSYLKLLFEQYVAHVSSLRRLALLPKLMSSLAAISGHQLVLAGVAKDLQEPYSSLGGYLALLESMFLIKLLPAWSSNSTNRTVKQPKAYVMDSGLTGRLLRSDSATATDLLSPIAGILFETFVFSEIYKQLNYCAHRYSLSHYRDTRQREVDLVIENDTGEIMLVEVKASSTAQASDFKTMSYLHNLHPERVKRCLLIYTGVRVHSFGDRQLAIPAQMLWGE